MTTLEQVEKLREKTSVSFEEAKNALDNCNGDILEAIIYLEKQGKVNAPVGGGYYSSTNSSTENEQTTGTCNNTEHRGETFGQLVKRFGRFCARIFKKGNSNTFEASKDGTVVVSVPVTVLAIGFLFLFWIILPLLIVGLFFGYRYSFHGKELGKDSVNNVMSKATDAAEDIKRSFNSDK